MKTKFATRLIAGVIALGVAGAGSAIGQETNTPGKYVTREEYEKVLKELAAIKQMIGADAVKKAAQEKETQETFDDYDKQFKSFKSLATAAQPGMTKPLLTGYAFAGYTDRKGANSTFEAGFNPIFLWKLTDRLFFEGELEIELGRNPDMGEGTTEVGLEYANLSYIANDYMTFKAGRFLSPFGTFAERLHPAWINKLPDAPLAFGHGGVAPGSELGVQVSGGFPAGPTKLNYAVYVSNGPRLNTGAGEPGEAGLLHFDNNIDVNNGKAVGTRIGFLPIPELELGYSFQYAQVGEGGGVNACLHAVDLSYMRDSKLLKGVIDVRAQWVWSKVDNFTFDPDGSLGFGPLNFNNQRDGGYVQAAYRPSKVGNWFVQNLEGVCRWEMLNNPGGAPAESAFDETRWTLGLNYWLGSSTVIKAAYQFGDRHTPGEGKENVNAILLQAAMGF